LVSGDTLKTFAKIEPQNIDYPMPPIEVDTLLNEGDEIKVGDLTLTVWHTPGHTDSQLAFQMGKLLFSGDNIYRDGCVGAIDAHHGSSIPHFIKSLRRIRDSEIDWLLPSHGPVFRRDEAMLNKTIDRVSGYLHMADFGTCALDWPLMDEFEKEVTEGRSATWD
jgi:hydroxyacylglutathione hydrolase